MWPKLILFTLSFTYVYAGESCRTHNAKLSEWCRYGCCLDDDGDTICCDLYFSYGWAIAVGVVGCVLLVVAIVTLVVYCLKKNKKPGRVVVPDSTQVYALAYSQPYYGTQVSSMHVLHHQNPPAPYPAQSQTPYPPPYSSRGNNPVNRPGPSEPIAPRQESDRWPSKQPMQEPEGITAPAPPAYTLPSSHHIV